MVFLVLLRVDGGKGTVVVACEGLQQDPLFPDKVVLTNVHALSWPFHGKYLAVNQWSVNKDVVINWMVGQLQGAPVITPEMVNGEQQDVPWPPGSLPAGNLGDGEKIRKAVDDFEAQQNAGPPPQEPPPTPQEPTEPPDEDEGDEDTPEPSESREKAPPAPQRPRIAPIQTIS
jgi:hypothetical protein